MNFLSISVKRHITLGILLFVNFLFSYKYLLRATDHAIYLAMMLVVFQMGVYIIDQRIHIPTIWTRIVGYGLMLGLAGLVVVSYKFIPLETLKVDRYSVITSFMGELFNGNYPYFAKSHEGNYPGPMPVYFLLAYPWYLVGELSILSFLGYGILIWMILKKDTQVHSVRFELVLLATSLFVFWEITTRSNIITYSVFILLLMIRYFNNSPKTALQFLVFGFIAGLLLCTRSVYVVVYIILFLPTLINKQTSFKNCILLALGGFLGFVLLFIPLLVVFFDEFIMMNPFTIQSSFLVPPMYSLLFMIIALAFSFLVRQKIDAIYYSGLCLFISIAIYAMYNINKYGFESAYFGSKVDISYFLFCVPFLVYYLVESKHDASLHRA